MAKLVYKAENGTLHIGGGNFFYANEPVEVENADDILAKYPYLEKVGGEDKKEDREKEGEGDNTPEEHTEASLKKLNAEEQKEIIVKLGGDVEATGNEAERIGYILELQNPEGAKG